MSILAINDKSFESEVVNSELPVLIDFWAEWCGPCKEISPILDEINNEMHKKIKIVKVNIDDNPNIPNQYGVQSIPTLIIFKKGLFNSDFETENNLISILNPLINSKSVWKSHALYLMAEYFYSKNQKQKAKEFYNQIITLENSNENIKLEAQKKLRRDFGE